MVYVIKYVFKEKNNEIWLKAFEARVQLLYFHS